jgi:hypothetical protein
VVDAFSLMFPDLQIRLVKLVSTNPGALDVLDASGFDLTHLLDEHQEAVDFVRSYRKRVGGGLPPLELLATTFPDAGYSDAEIAEGDTVVSLATAVRDDHRHASIRALVDDWNSKQEEFLRNPDMYGAMEAELKVILSEHSASSSLLTRLTDVNQDLWTEYVHMHKKIAVGFPLPFPFLQQVLNGLKTEEMTTVVARTSVGKSWVALLQAIHAVNFLENPPEILKSAWGEDGFESRFGETVLFVSFEMSAKRVYSRLACILAEVPYGAVRRGQLTKEEMIKYKHFLSHCKDGAFAKRFLVLPPSAVTDPVKLVASARDVNARLIIADSMDRMNGPRYKGMKDEPRLGSIWEEAQLLSIDPAWRHHIFCTTQLNRDAAGGRSVGADKVAGADRIGRATDNLIFLLQSRQQKRRRQVSITADKARDAATGDVYKYQWDWANTSWGEIGPEQVVSTGGGAARTGSGKY